MPPQAKVIRPPKHCPMCGVRVEVVRHIIANMFEMMCEACSVPCVVHVNDFEKIR